MRRLFLFVMICLLSAFARPDIIDVSAAEPSMPAVAESQQVTIDRSGTCTCPPSIPDSATLPLSLLGGGKGTFSWYSGTISDHPAYVRHLLTFMSAIDTGDAVNDTVRIEYYRPKKKGKLSAVLLLHTFSGPGIPEHTLAHLLAQNGTAVFLLELPHFGIRAGKNLWAPLRLRSETPEHIRDFLIQAACDARRARAVLASLAEIDSKRIDVVGISLGSFVAVLAGAAEPTAFRRYVLMLAGGPLEEVLWFSRLARQWKETMEREGLSYVALREKLAPVNILAYAKRLTKRPILMINAKRDQTIPPKLNENLFLALDRPQQKWYDTTHYTMMFEIIPVSRDILTFFK